MLSRTICRMGPTALTIAEPAGFVVKFASTSSAPWPSRRVESASAYASFGVSPVTEACTSPMRRPVRSSSTRASARYERDGLPSWFALMDPALVRGYGEDDWIRYETGSVVAGRETRVSLPIR